MQGCYFNRRMGALIRPETSPNAPQLTGPPYTISGENEENLAQIQRHKMERLLFKYQTLPPETVG